MTLPVDYRLTAPVALHARFGVRGVTALLGRSGAGKTSLLKALAGLLPAAGTPWAGMAPAARPVGYVPQNAGLFPHLSVLENAAFPLRGADRLARGQALLESLGVGHLAARPATKISGGEAQRVALARALARRPQLLLLDEPTAALDAVTREATLAWLSETVATQGIPALAATHDFAVAGAADWVALLVAGRIVQEGTPAFVYANPVSIEAAELLGYVNFFEVDGIVYTIRTEDIVLGPSGRPMVITGVRPQGADTRLTCGAFTAISRGGAAAFAVGQTVGLQFPPDKVKALG